MVHAHQVALFWPNIIGYFRVLCSLASFVLMTRPDISFTMSIVAIFLYIANFVGDLFDGLAARRFDQCSTFGSMLDMLTDRCSTVGLLMVLVLVQGPIETVLDAVLSPLVLIFLVLLDFSSHWIQTFSALLLGGEHHKSDEGNEGRNILVQWFYKYYWFFGYCCVGTEFAYIFRYAQVVSLPRLEGPLLGLIPVAVTASVLHSAVWVCIPACITKQIVNVAQLTSGFGAVAKWDADKINGKSK